MTSGLFRRYYFAWIQKKLNMLWIQHSIKETIAMGNKTERRKMIQQGDVLLIPIQTPTAAELRGQGATRKHQDKLVLAMGEVTGHQHVVEDVDVLEGLFGSEVVILADEPTELKHLTEAGDPTGEHETIKTDKGAYLVRLQRTYVAPTVAPRESWRNE
jgi:hypothetical protein